MKLKILSHIPASINWRENLLWVEETDSTNTQLKALAAQGAPHGTILIADHQTGGRGRLGRTFLSPAGKGIYLSVLLRPLCPPGHLMHLTCAAAVAMCDAIENSTQIRPGIKWTNDLVYQKRKLGGILTELSLSPDTGLVEWAIIGIGINVLHSQEDFPADLQKIATSLSATCSNPLSREKIAASMICSLYRMYEQLQSKPQIMMRYRKDCITLGQDISLLRGDSITHGHAEDVDEDGALVVRFSDGQIQHINSGEVSIRGMYGYL